MNHKMQPHPDPKRNQIEVMPRDHEVYLIFESGEPPAVKVKCNLNPLDLTRDCATLERGCKVVDAMDEDQGVYQSQNVLWFVPDIDLTAHFPIALEKNAEPWLIVGNERGDGGW